MYKVDILSQKKRKKKLKKKEKKLIKFVSIIRYFII